MVLEGHRVINPPGILELGGEQIAMLETALERGAADLDMNPPVVLGAACLREPAFLLGGQTLLCRCDAVEKSRPMKAARIAACFHVRTSSNPSARNLVSLGPTGNPRRYSRMNWYQKLPDWRLFRLLLQREIYGYHTVIVTEEDKLRASSDVAETGMAHIAGWLRRPPNSGARRPASRDPRAR